MTAIDRLILGSVDINVLFAPDPRAARRADAIETTRRAAELGMRAVVLRSDDYPTMPVVITVNQLIPEVQLVGGITLGQEVGGLNLHALESSVKMGAKVVWLAKSGGPVADAGGKLRPEAQAVLDLVRRHDLTLCTGDLPTSEVNVVVKEARGRGVHHVIVSNASALHRSPDALKSFTKLGAYIEHTLNAVMPWDAGVPPKEVAALVRAVGSEWCVLSTGFGQAHHPIAAEGMRMAIATMLNAGLDEMEVGLMVKDNPARLIGL